MTKLKHSVVFLSGYRCYENCKSSCHLDSIIEQSLRAQMETSLSQAFYNFGRMLDTWAQRTLTDLQLRFDAHADGYRAHLHRLSTTSPVSEADAAFIRRDLDRLTQSQTRMATDITSGFSRRELSDP